VAFNNLVNGGTIWRMNYIHGAYILVGVVVSGLKPFRRTVSYVVWYWDACARIKSYTGLSTSL
jgi:hypothetical protein